MPRARQENGDEARPLIDSSPVGDAGDLVWGEGTKPEARFAEGTKPDARFAEGTKPDARFAAGTLEMERLSVEVIDEPITLVELAAVSQSVFIIGADRIVVDVNDSAEKLVGYPRSELIGQRLTFFADEPISVSRDVHTFVGAMHHRNGREVTVNVMLCPREDGSSIAFMTARAPHERVPRNTEVVQIVHDFKNPLATIALEMCILEDKLIHTDLRGAITRVTQNVAYLDRMVQDLLDADSIESHGLEIHRRPTELRSLIEHAIERATATRDRARVFFEAPRPVSLALDDLRIERVVTNLLHNALKYSPSSTGVVIKLDVESDLVRVSVIDAGPGIRPEERRLVFEKYGRAASAHGHEGNGLGLYVSKRIVEAHGGRIGVEGVQPVGARFFFELPRA